ncbi:MAG: threonine ammonia-lyase, biosynthetic [Gammaproteobacteria bacterium]|nr:threonine ammonia-lyase, biosynthetic [Gammaproteobacteria bacterium]
MAEYLERILKARVYDVAIETPLDPAPRLSARLGNQILLKREDLQPVFSFKLRGAYNKLAQLTPAERAAGVICSSAGNHGQGVALAGRAMGVRAVIVMPTTTPTIKSEAVRALGGEVVLHGITYDDAYARAQELAAAEGLTFVHPFDDPDVIAGQGTIGMEILRQHQGTPDAIFVPAGGGGLISGIALYVKALYPSIRIIGVEPEESPTLHAALQAGHPVSLEGVGLFVDGVAVRRVGDETFRICRELVDEVILVSNDEVCAAIRDVFEDTRAVMEPAGALAVAGLKRWLDGKPLAGRTFVAVNSGANLNFDRLRYIAERAGIGEHREALLAVEVPEKPGSFRIFCETIGSRNITEFNYRYADPARAHIFVGVGLTGGLAERAQLIASLEERGYPVVDLSDDELAKLHVRHMVGGLAPGLRNERLYHFVFPERPGALLGFLKALGNRWNISLFHYTNPGADFGRVLTGIQVPDAEMEDFLTHLRATSYEFREETANPIYRMFLASD